MSDTGIRLTSLPDLETPDETSRVAGAKGLAIGTFPLPALKGWVLSETNAALDAQSSAILTLTATSASASALLEVQTQVEGLANTAALLLATDADTATALLEVQTRTDTLENTAQLLLESDADTASALQAVQTQADGLSLSASSQVITNATTASSITSLTVAAGNQGTTLTNHANTLTVLGAVNATLGATYSVKTDVNGYVLGYGLTNTGSAVGSGIIFDTPAFKIFDGTTGQTPFELAGGVVSIKNAAIQTAAIDQFKLDDGSVITAKMALNSASEAFSFYTAESPQWLDTLEHIYVQGFINVPMGGNAYLFPRAQGWTYEGTTFVFRVYANAILVGQLENPISNFQPPYGTQSTQQNTPQTIVFGPGLYDLQINFRANAVPANPADTPRPVLGHLVGFVLKR